MMVLFIKHIDIEGPGTIANFLNSNNVPQKTINPFNGDSYPDDPTIYSAIVSLGGPMNVYEEEKYPFLKLEDSFLKNAVKKEVPVLGICLGAQLLAKAVGAKVVKAKAKEIGWYKIPLTSNGKKDPLFQGINNELNVFQWHGDTFNIPDGGKRLAKSEICPNQAFRYGKNAYGIQFHVEVTKQMILDWIKAYKDELNILKGKHQLTTPQSPPSQGGDKGKVEKIALPEDIIKDCDINCEAYNRQANQFYLNFFRLAGALK